MLIRTRIVWALLLFPVLLSASQDAGSGPLKSGDFITFILPDDGPNPEPLAAMLLEFNDRLLERLTLGGTLNREQLIEGAEAIWVRTIYGTTAAVDQMPATS